MAMVATADHAAGACALCNLIDVPDIWAVDGARIAPRLQKLCSCEQTPTNFMVDVGTSMLVSRPDALAWFKQNSSRRVIGFEAHPSNCKTVYKSFSTIRQQFVCKAVADRAGTLMLDGESQEGSLNYTSADNLPSVSSSLTVPVTTLDIELPQSKRIWVLKMDVQGSEVHVLRGAQRLLDRGLVSWIYTEVAPYLLRDSSTRDSPSSASTLLDMLEKFGFACVNSRRRNRHRLLGQPDRAAPAPTNGSKVEFCGYSCPCKYTNILCGHKRVAVAPRRWKEVLLRELCEQPNCTWRQSWQGLGRQICTPPGARRRILYTSNAGDAGARTAKQALTKDRPLEVNVDWRSSKVRIAGLRHPVSGHTKRTQASRQPKPSTDAYSVVFILSCLGAFIIATCMVIVYLPWHAMCGTCGFDESPEGKGLG